MNSWLVIRRLRGPAFLLLFGVTALLHQWHILSFSQSWPLYLVLAGVLALAERAAFRAPDPSQMPPQYPPYSYPPQPAPGGWQTQPASPSQTSLTAPGTGIVPAPSNDLARNDPAQNDRTEGGQ
jgi:hypothetical protein